MSKPCFCIHFFVLFYFLTNPFFVKTINAQPSLCGDPSSICSTSCYVCDLDGFSGTNDDANGPGQLPPGYCTNILHHAEWLGFVAGSTNLSIEISVSNCVGGNQGGLEAGIYSGSNCTGFSLVSDCPSNIGNGTSQVINTTVPLVVGEIYWLVTDGNGVNNCDYSITVLSGSASPPAPDPIPQINGMTSFCVGQSETFSINPVTGGPNVSWTFDGNPAGVGPNTNISFPTAGTFDVCVTASNDCGDESSLCTQVTVSAATPPTFTQLGPYCQNGTPDPLPTTSTEGISGTWSPATISTASAGTSTYTFTPDPVAHPCASPTTMDVTVAPEETATFTQLGPYCQNGTPDPLPTTSTEGISGTWSPATISTASAGTSTYTFTPDPVSHPCASPTTMDVTVAPEETATFTQLGPYCQNGTPDPLPTASTEGISGTWSPATISTASAGTSTYTFTPDPVAHPCASPTTMDVTVAPEETATFTQLGPYCQNGTPDPLPTTSTEGISGTWSPATISTASAGTSTYTFTPDPVAHPCASPTTMDVTVAPEETATFTQLGPYCQNGTPDPLPTASTEGISGTWSPATISTASAGTSTYTFTPDPVAHPCASPTTMDVTVAPEETATFSPIGPLCQNSAPPALPPTSLEGISGTWNPAGVNTSATGSSTYTFTPNTVLHPCATMATLNVTVLPDITVAETGFDCAADLLTYDLDVFITGGSGTYISVDGGGFTVVDQGGGNYTVEDIPSGGGTTITVTDDAGCSVTYVSFPQNCDCPTIAPPTNPQGNIFCFGESPTPISVDDPGTGFQINWYDGTGAFLSNDNPFTPTAAGTYSATIEEISSGCESQPVNVVLTENPQIIITEGIFDCAADLLTYDLELNVSGGSGTYTNVDAGGLTVVDNGGGTYTIEGIPSGNGVTVTVTDDENCTATLNTLPQNCDCPTIASPTNPQGNTFCFGGTPTPISVDGPGAGFQVNWYDGTGTFLSNDNPYTPATAGTYSATIEEISSGCESASVDAVLTENPEITIAQGTFDCSADLTEYDLEITVSGGSGTFTNVDAGGLTVVDNGSGNYTVEGILSGNGVTVTVTDDENCTATLNTLPQNCDCPTIASPTNPQGNTFCFGGTPTPISVDGPGAGFQVNWYDGTGTFLSNDNPYTPATAGTYSATIEEISSGCESASVDAVLTENPEITIAQGTFDCSADLTEYDLEITVSGGSGTFTNVDAGGLNVVDNGSGNYTVEGILSGNGVTVTVTDDENCTATLNTVPQNCDCPTIASPTNPQGNTFCFGGTPTPISVDGPGAGFQVNWYDGTGTFLSNDNPYTPATAGTYSATVEEISSGCESASVDAVLTENPEITITQGTFDCSTDLTTYDLEINVGGGSGTYTNVDAGGLTVVDNGSGNYTVEGIASGSGVTVTVTDDENCTATLNTVPQNCDCPTINPPTDPQGNIYCFGGTPTPISVDDPGAGFQVNWYDAGGTFLSNDNPYTPATAGTYSATIEEISSGCESASVDAVLTENPEITIAQGTFDCSADLTEYDLEITVSGGSGTFTNVDAGGLTVVDNGSGNYTVEGILSGNGVTVTVIDDENCTATLNTVPQNCDCPTIAPPTNPQGNIYCFGESPTPISVDDPGAGFQVNWYDAGGSFLSNDNPFTPAAAGVFTATIAEVGTNCESLPVTVTLTENPEILLTENDFECAMDLTTYDLEITVSGGSGTYAVIDASGLNVVDMGSGVFTIDGIASGSGATITVTDDEGCSATFTTTPQNCDCANVLAPTNPQGATICFGDAPSAISVDNPGAGFEVSWFDAMTGGALLGTGASFIPPNVGVFYAEITDLATGCVSERVEVELDEANEITASTNTQICESDLNAYDLEVEIASGNAPYQVTAGGLNVVQNSLTNFTIEQVSGAAIGNVDILDDLGCAQTVSLQPTIFPMPVAEAGADQSLDCMVGETVLGGSTALFNPSIEWSPTANIIDGGNTLEPTVDAAGWYFLTVTNSGTGCSATDSVEVISPDAFTAEFSTTPTGCAGEENGSIAVADIDGGMEPFLFSVDGGTNFSTENMFQNLAVGQYEIVVQDGNGCEFSETVSVAGAAPITLQLEATADLALGDSYPINVQTNLSEGAIESIFWTPTETLDCGDCLEPTATPMATTTYSLTVADTLGCSASASITLMVDTRVKIYAPNAFSPNGDGFNDEFTIFAGEGAGRVDRMQIFNRWGDLVFENYNFQPGDLSAGWDGMYNGEMMNPDVFVFYAEIIMVDGRVEMIEGEVMLVR